MKRVLVIALALVISVTGFAQKDSDKEKEHGFKKENLFVGGDVAASFYSGGTSLGVSPYFGYSLNRFIDVAASFNFNYTSQRDYDVYGDKARQTVYGPGGFVRIFPVRFLYAQAQYEHNFIKFKYMYPSSYNLPSSTTKLDANSLLVGAGYCGGREGVGDLFYYFSISWDVTKVAESPYVDGLGRNFPIIKAGLQVPLFQGNGGGRDRGYHRSRRGY
ncbi:hypothetical protein [Ferruginibacter sp.]